MRLILMTVLIVGLCGCGKGQPTLAGGKPVSHWALALKDPDARLRKKAVFKLGNVGPMDAAVLPALLRALRDTAAEVRCEAVLALLKFGPGDGKVIPALAEVQKGDRDARVRSYAARALDKLKGASRSP